LRVGKRKENLLPGNYYSILLSSFERRSFQISKEKEYISAERKESFEEKKNFQAENF
jgi:hypothetical protein